MQKKVLWSSIIVLLIILIALFLVLLPKTNDNLVGEICDPYSNSNLGLEACDCLEDIDTKKICQENMPNAVLIEEAVNNSDLSACYKILVPENRESCLNIVQGKIDYTKQNEPLLKAGINIK